VSVALLRGFDDIFSMPKLANVALPVAVDSTFTYLIPPELERSATIGVRVLVPFGTRYATGVIIEHPASTSLPSLKPIKDVLDASPVLSEELLKLCRWIADYYMAPLGEVVKNALPHGLGMSAKRMVRLAATATPATIAAASATSRQRAKLFTLLNQHGEMTSAELQKRTGLKNIYTVLNELVQQGLVETEEVLPRHKVKLPTKEFLVLHRTDAARLQAELQALPPRKKRARRLLETVLSLQSEGVHEVPVQDLLKRSGSSTAVLKEYKQSGLLQIEKREITAQQRYGTEEQTLTLTLNADQAAVLNALTLAMAAGTATTFLLHGVTGSGKTQVYIEAIRVCLQMGKSALVLVPEISLTPQIARRFKSHFQEQVAVVHSNMSPTERHEVWERARRGDYRVIIGPRSAVFAPLRELGLIVVDEEHEPSYKQFDTVPRYHARDVAIVRGKLVNATVVLGSATPSAESYFNAKTGKYRLLEMPVRVQQVSMPAIVIVDMIEERKREYQEAKAATPEDQRMKLREFQQSSFSALLRERINDRLMKKEGIILLQNRRGFAPFIECMECGYSFMCSRCNVTLTYHLTRKHLRCHYCGLTEKPPASCPQCHGIALQQRGAGTQRVEQELSALFPHARVLRMDLDTTSRKGAHERLLQKFGDGEADILLGTQMVAKGLDFPRVTLVGVISADIQMLLPDFRASERTFQLLTQVAGRAGRSTLKGEVIIQTHQPKHHTLQHVVDHNYAQFMEEELEERRELNYPPFARLALIEFKGTMEERVRQEAERFARSLRSHSHRCTVLGPSPAAISKIKNNYRWHILLKSVKASDPSGMEMHAAIRKTLAEGKRTSSAVRITIDIDPVGLM
jgi:primosomal protein N' (replication factor Y)